VFSDNPDYQGFNRYDTDIVFRTLGPNGDWVERNTGVDIPQEYQGEDWYGFWDTSQDHWTDPRRGSMRFEYHPPERTNEFAEALGAAAMIASIGSGIAGFGGSSLFGDFFGSLGDFGGGLGNLFGGGGNAAQGLQLPASLGGGSSGVGFQLPSSLGGTGVELGLQLPSALGGPIPVGSSASALSSLTNNPLTRVGRMIYNQDQQSNVTDAIEEERRRRIEGQAASAGQGALAALRGRQRTPMSIQTYQGAGPFGRI